MDTLEEIINKYKLQYNKDKSYLNLIFNLNIMHHITHLKIILNNAIQILN